MRRSPFASLRKDQSIQSITLQEAMDLFKLPRTLGERDGEVVIRGYRPFRTLCAFGCHLRQPHPEDDPLEIDLRRAVELIDLKRSPMPPATWANIKGEMIVQGRGRFGPFVKFGKVYANIPKARTPR
jgi:DNA topoisomerase-1